MFWKERGKEVEKDSYEEESIGRESKAIKNAFDKIKEDIFSLGDELYSLRQDITDIKSLLSSLNSFVDQIKIDNMNMKDDINNLKNTKKDDKQLIIPYSNTYSNNPTHIPTMNHKIQTNPTIPTQNPTHPQEIGGLKYPNLDSSMRNRGVPTDRQTNQQTDNSTHNYAENATFETQEYNENLSNHIDNAENILKSLDHIKKEIRIKFKSITTQEMLVFSTIYQLEETSPEGVDYRAIASKLSLSESSIRDYVQKLISKGIPIDKIRFNNKKILLKISQKLKKIAPLETIIKLREI